VSPADADRRLPATVRQQGWWRDAVFYQIYPRSFADANGDGVGDLRGISSRLDHLRGREESLGVDAIWLSPFYRSPMADFGYDVEDHCDVDPVFGSLADFDELLGQAHERGLRVIIDYIPNHTSDRHPWFQASRRSRDDPKRRWYVWRPGRDGRPPNEWRSEFASVGPAWTLDPATGEWYLHSFLPQQPDLDWGEPEVERAMTDVLRFWLDRGVDGFRADVIYKIGKDPRLRDNPVDIAGPGSVPGRRHDEDWPTTHQRLRRMRRVLKSYGQRMMVGEVYLLDPHRMARYIRTGRELDLAHDFTFLRLPWRAEAFRDHVEAFTALIEPRGWPTWCLENHDHSRVASRYPGEGAARVAAMMLLTLRGTPFLYQGQELGLADGEVPPDRVVDVDGRDPVRCPMPWEPPSRAGPGAGFTSGSPWLPLPPEPETRNVRSQLAEPGSVLDLHRRLIAVRRQRLELRRGSLRVVRPAPAGVFAYLRRARAGTLLVALNLGERATTLDARTAGADEGRILVRTDRQDEGAGVRLRALELPPLTGILVDVGHRRS
jgi:alpha-glucosidase